MRSGKSNPIWLGLTAVIVVACLGGGSMLIVSMAGSLKKVVENKKQEREANSAIEQNVRKLLEGKTLGQRPTFAETPVGEMQRISYLYLETQIARQKTFMDELAKIKFDWVMSPDSLRSAKNLDESLSRLNKARELADWFYGGLEKDLNKSLAEMKEKAAGDKNATEFVSGFEFSATSPGGSNDVNRKVARALKQNHDALEGCLKTLKANLGKYAVNDDGTVTFKVGTSDHVIDEYNKYVEATTQTMNEINRLETKRAEMINDSLSKMPK